MASIDRAKAVSGAHLEEGKEEEEDMSKMRNGTYLEDLWPSRPLSVHIVHWKRINMSS